mmetsp:Transcript_3720/g.13034  ORF Transcript_3720/g.13034 Transcript_3720/m.13034 type:complete len:226 (-) Transcript_3720:881-1558(-)
MSNGSSTDLASATARASLRRHACASGCLSVIVRARAFHTSVPAAENLVSVATESTRRNTAAWSRCRKRSRSRYSALSMPLVSTKDSDTCTGYRKYRWLSALLHVPWERSSTRAVLKGLLSTSGRHGDTTGRRIDSSPWLLDRRRECGRPARACEVYASRSLVTKRSAWSRQKRRGTPDPSPFASKASFSLGSSTSATGTRFLRGEFPHASSSRAHEPWLGVHARM